MGVQGLKAQLELYYSPEVTTLHEGSGNEELLLVDASAVKLNIYTRLGFTASEPPEDWATLFYTEICHYFQALNRTGLKLLVVLEGAMAVGVEEATLGHKQREVIMQGHLVNSEASMVFLQALKDLDVKYERALHATDSLLLATYVKFERSIFALLTNDTDFLVYGAEKLVFVNDMTVDTFSTTFPVWSTSVAWLEWRRNRMTRGVHPVSLMTRAQIAAVLGCEVSNAVRVKPWTSAMLNLPSPLTAAELLIASPVDDDLSVKMFQDQLGMKDFGEADLSALNTVMRAYLATEADSGQEYALLCANAFTLPHLAPEVAARIAGEVVVPVLIELATRGMADFPAQHSSDLALFGAERAAAVKAMFQGDAPPTYLRDPHTLAIQQITAGGGAAPENWVSEAIVPALKAAATSAAAGASAAASGSLSDTVAALQKLSLADTPARLATLHALMLQAATPKSDFTTEAVREALLPGVPAIRMDTPPPQAPSPENVAAELAAAAAACGLSVDTGSSLTSSDWLDIDSKDLVARAKATMAFKIMREILPWSEGTDGNTSRLVHDLVFKWFYVNRKDDMYKKLAKTCYPEEYGQAREDKDYAKDLKALTKEGVMEELKKGKEKHTIAWMEAISKATVLDILFLRREAIKAGPGSVEWHASLIVWNMAGDRAKEEIFELMHTSINKIGKSGAPRRYKHQEELMQMVGQHLSDLQNVPKTLPLQVILATPTGSGKTFTAVMMHLYLLKEKFPEAVLLYSVPTKQVLKRVGQECEAHGVIYWTAARDGDLHQVRRPYSIRFSAKRRREQAKMLANPEKAAKIMEAKKSSGSGTIEEQMFKQHENGKLLQDQGLGKPDVIIADVFTTAALLAASRQNEHSFFAPDKLVLYFDEPNMGIKLEPTVSTIVHKIMNNAPMTTILASATMPNWDSLPAWWKGPGLPAKRTTIPLDPYDLPMCKLQVLDENTRKVTPVSLLGLFKSHAEYVRVMKQQGMRRIIMLRYLTPPQANMLLENKNKEGGRDYMALYGDVRTLRQSLEPTLLSLSQERFSELQNAWKGKPVEATANAEGIAAAVSVTGVTMVATLNARQSALAIADKFKTGLDVHEIRRRCREAAKTAKAAEKEAARKKDDDATPEQDVGAGKAGFVELRNGLSVSLADAEECDDETLVMLSKGVAYTLATGTEPLVKKLYMQALLHVPDHVGGKARALPPIHVLVVDYSSIYGTDCPAVDTLIMDETLGRHLSWEDHQQALGRLRRDGTAIFLSKHTMRLATLGRELAGPEEESEEVKLARTVRDLCLQALRPDAPADAGSALSSMEVPSGCGPADVAHHVLRTIVEMTLPAHAGHAEADRGFYAPAMPHDPKSLPPILSALKERTKKFLPVIKKGLKSGREQYKMLQGFHMMCRGREIFEGGTSGASKYVAAVLHLLYELEVVEEPAILTWANEYKKTTSDPDKFALAAQPFVTWLEEADSDEESDEDDE